jgi:predicted dehydrogenase
MFGYPKKGAYLMSHTRSTRRDFLKRSTGVVAAGVAAPFVWTGSHAGAASKNDRIGVAAIGVGGSYSKGRWQWARGSGIGIQAAEHGNIVACCDVDRRHAEMFAAHFDGKCDIHKDYRKVIERKDVDAITIGTPDHWHTAIAVAALRAGKDVYCEKPLTLTIDESKLISKVVEQTGRVFQVGTHQRSEYGGRFLKVIALIKKERLGRVHTVTCSIGTGPRGGPFQETNPPKELDWDFWLGQAPMVPYVKERCHRNFRWWLEYSGGKMTDWGAHHIDIAHWGLGKELAGPVEIKAMGDLPQEKNCFNTAITFLCILTFEDGAKIIVRDGPGNGILFEGTKGRIFVNRKKLVGKPVEELTDKDDDWMHETIKELYKGKEPGSHMRNFFECIVDRSQPISDVFTHHRTITSCHLCNIAMLLKRTLKWDPVKEMFPDDDEANAILSREQRKPYVINV